MIHEALQVKSNDHYRLVDLVVEPFTEPSPLQGLLLVVFIDRTSEKPGRRSDEVNIEEDADPKIAALEQELSSTRKQLQTTMEESEASNEELKSINEEMQSTNEELQSTNEELETSREELQSTNEELGTVNSELENKLNELSQANNDLNNLLSATEIGIVFLDNDLNIKRFTPTIKKVFNMKQVDIGRPISDITSNLLYEKLGEDAKQVLDSLNMKGLELQTKEQNWISVRILPYRTVDNVIDGLVITFMDIDELKRSENAFRESDEKFRTLLETAPLSILGTDKTGKITLVNSKAQKMFKFTRSDLVGKNIGKLISAQFREKHEDYRHNYTSKATTRPKGTGLIMNMINRDNREFKVELALSSTETLDGILVLYYISDIAESKNIANRDDGSH